MIMLRITKTRSNKLNTSIDNSDDRKYFCPNESPLNGIKLTNSPATKPQKTTPIYIIRSLLISDCPEPVLGYFVFVLPATNQRMIFITAVAKMK
jgi:hypothetical protein